LEFRLQAVWLGNPRRRLKAELQTLLGGVSGADKDTRGSFKGYGDINQTPVGW
jgi:hypothetical protein